MSSNHSHGSAGSGSLGEAEENGQISPGVTMPAVEDKSGSMLCTFEIVHNLISKGSPSGLTPRAALDEDPRHEPNFGGIISRRLLKHINAKLRVGDQPDSNYFANSSVFPGSRRTYTFSVLLPTGAKSNDEMELTAEEEAARQPYSSLKLAKEPTLTELAVFAETLRGRKVDLYASLHSVFAGHLTSYIAAWGMDISHFAIEDEVATSSEIEVSTPLPVADEKGGDRLIVIDDDLIVLKKQLLRIRAEATLLTLRPQPMKRPSLAVRSKSSPQIRSIQHQPSPSATLPVKNTVVIHFTSITKYNEVRDIVASILAISASNGGFQPEVVVIPKPVGPRRFLTALHTAISKPIIDPYFTPIATSPRSPGGSYFSPVPSRMPSGLEHPASRSPLSGVVEECSSSDRESIPEQSASPKREDRLKPNEGGSLAIVTPSGDVVATPAMEYFSDAASKMGSAAASGFMVQSPDGRPVGMFFDPPAKSERRHTLSSKPGEMSRRRSSARSSISSAGNLGQSPGLQRNLSVSRRTPSGGSIGQSDTRRGSSFRTVEEDDEGDHVHESRPPMSRSSTLRRKTSGNSPGQLLPGSLPKVPSRERSATITAENRTRSGGIEGDISGLEGVLEHSNSLPPSLASLKTDSRGSILQEAKAIAAARAAAMRQQSEAIVALPPLKKSQQAGKDSVIVPPINVLIVEDNPINQNILSMFLRKRKIKHQAANNGLEAVEKWRSGTFHLILMDIQLPVMDGIEATKEIRRMEKSQNIGLFPNTPTNETGSGSARAFSPLFEDVPATPLRSSVIIVALTASSLQQDRVNALAAGCNDFLTKPVSLKWLENKIVEWGCMQVSKKTTTGDLLRLYRSLTNGFRLSHLLGTYRF